MRIYGSLLTVFVLAAFTFCLYGMPVAAMAAEKMSLESYVAGFDYDAREDMKVSSRELIGLLVNNEAVLVDIRFAEEHAVWSMGFGLKIPLNELPARLRELPRDKLIVTACPHNDRANIARLYLTTQGFNAAYLTDGLLGLMQNLRGDAARDFAKKVPMASPTKTKN